MSTTLSQPCLDQCFIVPKRPAVFILLGRFGDLAQLLPAFKAIYDRTNQKPVVIVSMAYASILEGVSYVVPHPIDVHWWQGVPHAQRLAEEKYGGGTVLQWWHEPPERIQLLEAAIKGGLVLQSHGNKWGVDIKKWPDYGTSMWDRAGFSRDEMLTLPLVFDQRNSVRENILANKLISQRKPTLLYNFNGVSSPFTNTAEVLQMIRTYGRNLHLVDLGSLRAVRIYDTLGLMDRAAGMITIDTSTLHLAPATNVEYLAFVRDAEKGDWSGSIPKGNCTLKIKYPEFRNRIGALKQWIERVNQKTL